MRETDVACVAEPKSKRSTSKRFSFRLNVSWPSRHVGHQRRRRLRVSWWRNQEKIKNYENWPWSTATIRWARTVKSVWALPEQVDSPVSRLRQRQFGHWRPASTIVWWFAYNSAGFLSKLSDSFLEHEINHTNGDYGQGQLAFNDGHISRITFKLTGRPKTGKRNNESTGSIRQKVEPKSSRKKSRKKVEPGQSCKKGPKGGRSGSTWNFFQWGPEG